MEEEKTPNKKKLVDRIFKPVMIICAIIIVCSIIALKLSTWNDARRIENIMQNGTTEQKIQVIFTEHFEKDYDLVNSSFDEEFKVAELTLREKYESTIDYSVKNAAVAFIGLAKYLFQIEGIESISVDFNYTFLDEYGNESEKPGILSGTTKEEMSDVNYDNFPNMVWDDYTKLEKVARFIVSPALKKASE
ncbi:hypothetical protein RWV98_02980 [Agathobaculum sp. NTUH-O15-33]|uniref:hypothetical protein n=1 Tax=Agathobaculum sp. NTUH-O15-33 TaxID=3079302 RepID=UPI002958C490|nr:hypothetical protein [Agathobaculum sp. NTUH-O15-33]WNX85256.1 hypothetical protein RWV98_02980 [Agathobaculum sp. NTUH-O15-33]